MYWTNSKRRWRLFCPREAVWKTSWSPPNVIWISDNLKIYWRFKKSRSSQYITVLIWMSSLFADQLEWEQLCPVASTCHDWTSRQTTIQYFCRANLSFSISWNELAEHCNILRGKLSDSLQAQTSARHSTIDICNIVKWQPEQSCWWNSSVYHKCRWMLRAWELEVTWVTHSKVAR